MAFLSRHSRAIYSVKTRRKTGAVFSAHTFPATIINSKPYSASFVLLPGEQQEIEVKTRIAKQEARKIARA